MAGDYYFYPVAGGFLGSWPQWTVPVCQHCYCIDPQASAAPSKPHVTCCKCGERKLKPGVVTY